MKRRLISLLILTTLVVCVPSCTGLRESEKAEETAVKIIDKDGVELWCTDEETFKILLKEAIHE